MCFPCFNFLSFPEKFSTKKEVCVTQTSLNV